MIPHGYLIHHGIIGQKWGVRRFQNKDGSLTSTGKKRYNEGGSTPAEKFQKLKLFSPDTGEPIDEKQAEKIAKFGLEVMRNRWGDTYADPNNKSDQEWFLYEDQTIGQSTVVDMALRGMSKREIHDLIDEANDLYLSNYGSKLPGAVFDLAEGYDLESFADDCVDYRDRKKR